MPKSVSAKFSGVLATDATIDIELHSAQVLYRSTMIVIEFPVTPKIEISCRWNKTKVMRQSISDSRRILIIDSLNSVEGFSNFTILLETNEYCEDKKPWGSILQRS